MNDPTSITANPPFLELKNATVEIKDNHILKELSLVINSNEQTAIIGPNGSGKSTLIKVLTRQLYAMEPEDGPPPVRVFGKELWNVQELRSQMGIVSDLIQRDFLNNIRFGKIQGLDVVLSGFYSSFSLFPHHEITKKMKEKAYSILEQLESEYLAGNILNEMSTGEVQRVLIARALVTEPQVLILDEPTTGLDIVARQQCMSQIRKVAKEGTTIILVTHHIDEIFPEIERILLLKSGNIAFDGPKEDVLTSENLSYIYDHPLELTKQNGFYRIQPEP
jgi:iron complex transport system ATP-binding protein